MATFNGGRMVALFLCTLFALNASFAQDDNWTTVVVYMVDPILNEQVAPEVNGYIKKWNDPLSWVTYERDFKPARKGQEEQVKADNKERIEGSDGVFRR